MCKVYLAFYKLKRPKGWKTDVWEVVTMDNDELGYVKFRGAWRQYIFEPGIGTFWSHGCCDQISEFLKVENKKWRNKLKRKGEEDGNTE